MNKPSVSEGEGASHLGAANESVYRWIETADRLFGLAEQE